MLVCGGTLGWEHYLNSQPRAAQVAGNAVKRASDNLVKAAQKAAAFEDQENETVVVKEKMVGGIAQVSSAPGAQRGTVNRAGTLPVLVPATLYPLLHILAELSS